MEIKTCEQYVLVELANVRDILSIVQDELESEKTENAMLRELVNKYDELKEALYNACKIGDYSSYLPYIAFKQSSNLYEDDPSYKSIKEAIDDWARMVERPVKPDDTE